jgi:aminomethyltransferase
VTALAAFDVRQTRVADLSVITARTGYTGEDGFELFCAMDDAPILWDRLMETGSAHGIEAIGLGARDTLRLEARLSLYGNDIDETTNPIEAGLGWVVKQDKGDFVGREALMRVKQEKPARRLVGFQMVGRGIARHGYPILSPDGDEVGVVTSGAPGLSVGMNIGLGYVPRAMARTGTKLGIEIRGKVIEAMVVKTPFYKRS